MEHIYKKAIDSMGQFGKLFLDYKGCPRGSVGRACIPIEEEVLLMPIIKDVDGGAWTLVNADALYELLENYKILKYEKEQNNI